MLPNFKALVYGIVLVALTLFGYYVYRLLSRFDTPKLPPSVMSLALTEQEKFMVTQNHVTTIKRDAKGATEVKTEYVPNRAVITVNKDGSVSVKNQKFGLTFQPGLAIGYVDGPRVAAHAKWLYWSRLGLNTGISGKLSSSPDPRVFVALSYALISNTSVMVQYDNKQAIGGYLSVRF